MLRTLNKELLGAVRESTVNDASVMEERPCPNCGQKFTPFAGRQFTSWSDFEEPCICPHCGSSFTIDDLREKPDLEKANPKGPFARPAESRIERRQPAPHQLIFYIPSARRGGAWLSFAICWNLFVLIFVLYIIIGPTGGTEGQDMIPDPEGEGISLPMPLTISIFALIGIGMAYTAVWHHYGSMLLELSPENVRLQRVLLWWKKNRDLPAADVKTVSKVPCFSQDDRHVFAIKIDSGDYRYIHFGWSLTDDEKNWLCWEIREFLRLYARQAPVNSAVEALVRSK
jgi:hypothetical protein